MFADHFVHVCYFECLTICRSYVDVSSSFKPPSPRVLDRFDLQPKKENRGRRRASRSVPRRGSR